MAYHLSSDIVIDAPIQVVWQHLCAFDAYEQWNPFIKQASGVAEEGESLSLNIVPPGKMGMNLAPVVTECIPEKQLAWHGKVWFSGLFDGFHRFELQSISDGQTKLVQSESFKGILVPLLWPMIKGATLDGFQQMNLALKSLCEKAPL